MENNCETIMQCDCCVGLKPHRYDEEKDVHVCVCGEEKARVLWIPIRHGGPERHV